MSYSCEKKHNDNIYVHHYPETGNIGKYEYIIKGKDSTLHGNYTIYNPNGKVVTISYNNGEPYGEEIHYFESGDIESIHQVLNKKVTEERIYYHENGNSRKYILFEDFGETVFIVRFDEKENVVSYEGYPVIELYLSPLPLTLSRNGDLDSSVFTIEIDDLVYEYPILNS